MEGITEGTEGIERNYLEASLRMRFAFFCANASRRAMTPLRNSSIGIARTAGNFRSATADAYLAFRLLGSLCLTAFHN